MRREAIVVSQGGAPSQTREVLTDHHRTCALALARLHLLVTGDNDAIRRSGAIHDVARTVRLVLDEILAAEEQVLAVLADTDRRKPAARLLGGRLERLHDAAEYIGAASRAGDISWLRRYLTRFDALTRATCAVQLDVYVSAPTSTRRRRPHPAPSGPGPVELLPG